MPLLHLGYTHSKCAHRKPDHECVASLKMRASEREMITERTAEGRTFCQLAALNVAAGSPSSVGFLKENPRWIFYKTVKILQALSSRSVSGKFTRTPWDRWQRYFGGGASVSPKWRCVWRVAGRSSVPRPRNKRSKAKFSKSQPGAGGLDSLSESCKLTSAANLNRLRMSSEWWRGNLPGNTSKAVWKKL